MTRGFLFVLAVLLLVLIGCASSSNNGADLVSPPTCADCHLLRSYPRRDTIRLGARA
jgi:hypothetical protein